MNEKDKERAFVSLTDVLETWWETASGEIDMPLIGDNVLSHMSRAALNVLIAVGDTQQYLKAERMLTE